MIGAQQAILRRMFAGVTEHAFLEHLGIGDAHLTEYLADMLARFIHVDQLFRLRDGHGKRLEQVAAMLIEAEGIPEEGRTRREIFRHIGDFTLYWTGLFPEALGQMRSSRTKDFFIDYCKQGKRSYRLASDFDSEEYANECPILRRLSDEYELCALGLNHVRKELDHMQLTEDRRILH